MLTMNWHSACNSYEAFPSPIQDEIGYSRFCQCRPALHRILLSKLPKSPNNFLKISVLLSSKGRQEQHLLNSSEGRNMRTFLIVALLLAPFLISAQQVAKGLTAQNGTFIGFYEYKPTDYATQTSTRYPVIIFMHGIGERGNGTSELSRVLTNAIPRYINAGHPMRFTWNGKTETFLVLSPQLSASYGDWPAFYAEEMVKYAKNNLRIDTNRIIVTGLSLGGGGVWQYASINASNPKNLAAIAPVCGTCSMVSACNIANASLPTWAFHATTMVQLALVVLPAASIIYLIVIRL